MRKLSFLYGCCIKKTKTLNKQKIWEEDLGKYPEGVYNTVVKTFLEGFTEWYHINNYFSCPGHLFKSKCYGCDPGSVKK